MNSVIHYRNKILSSLYRLVLKPIFFLGDPETVHDGMMYVGRILGRYGWSRWLVLCCFGYQNNFLKQEILGISFDNPVGLSAGFDKDARLTDILPSVGFGFVEVGSITGEPCAGNSKPRLWRLKNSKSLVVYYGLKNDGCEAVARRLRGKRFKIPVGVSVAMTNNQENLEVKKGIADFSKAFRTMESCGDYITVNISCPNTLGGQPFVEPVKLELLLKELDGIATEKPVFIKLSPDLSQERLDAVLDSARAHRIHGIVCTNLTKNRQNQKIVDKKVPATGGMSGKVVQELADAMLAYIRKREGGRFVLVGCGGIFTAEDAYKKIRLGASLVQMITGMIFEGPQVISEINQGLVDLLKRDGFSNISEAVGVDI